MKVSTFVGKRQNLENRFYSWASILKRPGVYRGYQVNPDAYFVSFGNNNIIEVINGSPTIFSGDEIDEGWHSAKFVEIDEEITLIFSNG